MTTSITWPVDLGQAVEYQNGLQPDTSNVIRTQVGVGPAKTRQRSTLAVNTYPCTFIMKNDTERKRFLQFVQQDTLGASFNWKDPQNGEAAELRFVSVGQIQHQGNNVYRVDFVLERLS